MGSCDEIREFEEIVRIHLARQRNSRSEGGVRLRRRCECLSCSQVARGKWKACGAASIYSGRGNPAYTRETLHTYAAFFHDGQIRILHRTISAVLIKTRDVPKRLHAKVSGQSTTMHHALSTSNSPSLNISTLEKCRQTNSPPTLHSDGTVVLNRALSLNTNCCLGDQMQCVALRRIVTKLQL